MKIVEVCPYDMGRPGGVQNHIRDLAAWLTNQGHEVRIVAPPRPDRSSVPGIDCVGVPKLITVHGTLTEICYVPRRELAETVRSLRQWGADILHLHTPWTPLLPWQVWRSAKLPAVATFHATLPGGGQDGLIGKALRSAAGYMVRRLDAVVIPSVSPLVHFADIPGISPPVVLPPTIDLDPWFKSGQASARTSRSAQRVVFLGRFEQRKGLDVLLSAWRQVASRLPEAKLIIAGKGELEPIVIEAQAGPSGGSIELVREPSFHEARRLVADADLFVAPSPFGESFGIVLVEAMAAGTVPIAAANPGYATVMTGAGTDLLVPPGDAAALAERIEAMLRNPGKRARLRDWGERHARDFDVASVGPRYVDLFDRVLRQRRGA